MSDEHARRTTQSESERIIVYGPDNGGDANLAVSYNPNPGPHQTKFVVEQLWPPTGDDEHGRAEPVYVGDEQRAVGLIEALSQAIDIDMEVSHEH